MTTENEFVTGDSVICTSRDHKQLLTVGHIYAVQWVNDLGPYFRIKNDRGKNAVYHTKSFRRALTESSHDPE